MKPSQLVLAPMAVVVGLLVALGAAGESPFNQRETKVGTSPDEPRSLTIPAGERVVDFDVWSTGPEVALLVGDSAGGYKILFWDITLTEAQKAFDVPPDFEPRSIACHPAARRVFLSGRQGQQFVIVRFQQHGGAWASATIYKSGRELRRLIVGPRPFVTGYNSSSRTSIQSYRLFFGIRGKANYAIRSITEEDKWEYQVLGPKATLTKFPDVGRQPSEAVASWALPSAFHPAGNILLWENERHCFEQLPYGRDAWGQTSSLIGGKLCGGSVTVAPNGAALIHWRSGVAGITVYLDHGNAQAQRATGFTFVSTPSSVHDGKGVVGLVREGGGVRLVYVPISLPLADVANAWMFTEMPEDERLLSKEAGLFRQLRDDQLYQLYDSEAYYCGVYDKSTPTRPYFVTTDIFWELLAAAYEGTFIVQERQRAIPTFWSFVAAARDALQTADPKSKWAAVFNAVANVRDGAARGNPETELILRANGHAFSTVAGKDMRGSDLDIDYGELKPRGHYTSEAELANYFKAFRYLALVSNVSKELDPSALASLPPAVKTKAMQWIRSYQDYIAPGRVPLAWDHDSFAPPAYTRHLDDHATIFPLSWGFDNEVLLTTVFHRNWPRPEQIVGRSGPRIVPSGLDVAAALGSEFARSLLKDEIAEYPPLAAALDRLAQRSDAHAPVSTTTNLYDAWMNALAIQWTDDVSFPGVGSSSMLWKTKRLQTGLASWATLRHATVLVNERTGAECGEGGFEEIVLQPPRGYVEPDPKTFGAVADLFGRLAQSIESSEDFRQGAIPDEDDRNSESLRQGILRRLKETASKARLFQSMAEKELRGEELTPQEYEEILYVGRLAEHHFLVFKSLANKDLGLSTPDPMPKIVDVAGGRIVPLLEAGVGRPMEWDQIVPFYGRREIVKGSVYSYYEFTSRTLLNDSEWLQKLNSQPRPDWVKPYTSSKELSCPAKAPF